MRVFIGLPLDETARRGAGKIIREVRRGHWPVRWEDKEKWHATVAFIGNLENTEVDRVSRAVRKGVEGMGLFEVGFKGLGAFPDLFLPRVVWMGLKGDLKSMFRLVKSVRSELEKAGVEFDKKPFRAHVTLGRVDRLVKRKQRMELGKYLKKKRLLDILQKWLVDRVVVYESKLSAEGSEYRVVEEIQLKKE